MEPQVVARLLSNTYEVSEEFIFDFSELDRDGRNKVSNLLEQFIERTKINDIHDVLDGTHIGVLHAGDDNAYVQLSYCGDHEKLALAGCGIAPKDIAVEATKASLPFWTDCWII